MNLPECQQLNIKYLQRVFDNMSESYKIFWLKALVDQIREGKSRISYNDIISNMVADAWYMVTEYRLNLGPADTLETLVLQISNATKMKPCEKRATVLSVVKNIEDKDLQRKKQVLTYNVPYRLQAPFMSDLKGRNWDGPKTELVKRINGHAGLIYRFEEIQGLGSTIVVADEWSRYINENYEIIQGWIQYNLIVYLQKRNPSVPGIPNKINPPQERKLEKVKKLWKALIQVSSVVDIYSDKFLSDGDISIDHFIPWSYVAHDELWNLIPTTRSINSSKSNHLPDWDTYFRKLGHAEYEALQTAGKYESIQRLLDVCFKDHINNIDVRSKLYRNGIAENEFMNCLSGIMKPQFEAAHNMGFDIWTL